MSLDPYLFFPGTAQQAIDFYRDTLGAEVVNLMRFRDAPPGEPVPPGNDDLVMHASLQLRGRVLMMSDDPSGGEQGFQGFSLSLDAPSMDEARRLFDALSAGGRVQMPFGKTFWSEGFGMVKDRFGVPWMVSIDH